MENKILSDKNYSDSGDGGWCVFGAEDLASLSDVQLPRLTLRDYLVIIGDRDIRYVGTVLGYYTTTVHTAIEWAVMFDREIAGWSSPLLESWSDTWNERPGYYADLEGVWYAFGGDRFEQVFTWNF